MYTQHDDNDDDDEDEDDDAEKFAGYFLPLLLLAQRRSQFLRRILHLVFFVFILLYT